MATSKPTIWELEPHTRAKHEILKRYLEAWTPILTRGKFKEILYVDGFSGPGRYSGGEDGSPIIALNVAIAENVPATTTVRFLFVEKDSRRARSLNDLVKSTRIPPNFCVDIAGGQVFEEAFWQLIENYEQKGLSPPPTFMFVDPFGWTGGPFSTVKKMLSFRSCEVFVTFMYEEINRFIGRPDQIENFDKFFGTREWADCVNLVSSRDRERCLHNLYLRQLRHAAEAKYVRSFEMRNRRDAVDYFLFFATNNIVGLKKMKESMWKVDQTGSSGFQMRPTLTS